MEPDRIYGEKRERAATWTVRFALIFGVVGFVAVLSMDKPKEEKIERVVMRSLTVISNGLCLLRDHQTPVTGVVVDYHVSGQLKSHTLYRAGIMEGEAVEFPDERLPVGLDHLKRNDVHDQPGT